MISSREHKCKSYRDTVQLSRGNGCADSIHHERTLPFRYYNGMVQAVCVHYTVTCQNVSRNTLAAGFVMLETHLPFRISPLSLWKVTWCQRREVKTEFKSISIYEEMQTIGVKKKNAISQNKCADIPARVKVKDWTAEKGDEGMTRKFKKKANVKVSSHYIFKVS